MTALRGRDTKQRHPQDSNYTVKPLLSSYSKIDKTKLLLTNDSLMKVESIAECSHWSSLRYFRLALSDIFS